MYKTVLNSDGTPTNVEVNEKCEFRYIDTKQSIKLYSRVKNLDLVFI